MADQEAKNLEALKIRLAAELDFSKSLKAICDAFQVRHAVYHLAPTASPGLEIPFVQTTYSPKWIMRYIARNYLSTDPVLERGLGGAKPFFWSDVPRESPALSAFFEDAAAHGVGNCGYSIPIADRGGKRAMFTVNMDSEESAFRAYVTGKEKHLHDIAMILHGRALAETGNDVEVPALSRREIQCLNLTAQGKDGSSIAEILKISEFTVRDYLKAARRKLGCATIAQAVYEATRLRLIKR